MNGRRHGDRSRLLYTTHRHAEVLGLDDDQCALWIQCSLDGGGYLGDQPLLDLRPAGLALNKAG